MSQTPHTRAQCGRVQKQAPPPKKKITICHSGLGYIAIYIIVVTIHYSGNIKKYNQPSGQRPEPVLGDPPRAYDTCILCIYLKKSIPTDLTIPDLRIDEMRWVF